MSADDFIRRPDDLGRQLRTWMTETAPRQEPDGLVVDAIERTKSVRQRPGMLARFGNRPTERDGAFRGFLPETRIWATLAVVLVVIVGGLLALRGAAPEVASPTVAPTPSDQPASPSASAEPSPIPDALRSTWLADGDPIPAIGVTGSRLRLDLSTTGHLAGIEASLDGRAAAGGSIAIPSTILAIAPDEFQAVLDHDASGCAGDAVGRYRWSLSTDSVLLTITAIADACTVRAQALARTWTRSLAAFSNGGTGVVDTFDPQFQVTLPAGTWVTHAYRDAIEITRPIAELSLFAAKDPQGFTDPCAPDGGLRKAIAPGADAFGAYLRTLPGFIVTSTERQMDGHRAVHFAVTSSAGIDCPGGVIVEWQAKADAGGVTWHLSPGDPDSFDIVDLPTATILFQVIGATDVLTPDVERGLLDSVRFVEKLPSG